MSPWSHAQSCHPFSEQDWWLRNDKYCIHNFHRMHRCWVANSKSRLLPRTLWETLGSRKLSGSSSPPSLSQARPFCDLPAFFWALLFPSSSDKSLSDSARISSILERMERLLTKKSMRAWAKAELVFLQLLLPLALCFLCLRFALGVVLLLCYQFSPLGSNLSLADVCKDLVVFYRQHALHQLKPSVKNTYRREINEC